VFERNLGLNVVYLFVTDAMLQEAMADLDRAAKIQHALRADPESTNTDRVEAALAAARAEVRFRAMSRRYIATTGRKSA
jgi:hypothetical protein